jgi:aryl-alcohol dehydrogenase-like predicted oxidoreductase
LASAVGVSNYNISQMRRTHTLLIKRGLYLASNQVEYSLLDRRIEKNGLLNLCHDLGITCIAYSPLTRGLLSGKYHARNLPPGLRGRSYPVKYLTQIEPLIRLMREIGRAHESKSPVQVALNWVICKGAVPIPGVKTLKQAQENIGALGWQLTPEEISLLDQASDQIST